MMLSLQGEAIKKGTFEQNKIAAKVEELYKQCFHAYFEKLFDYAFTIVKDNGEAKDIVQSAFLKLWEKRGDVNLPLAARSYLYTTVYHLALNSVRNRKIRASHHIHIQPAASASYINTEEKEIKERIRLAIDSLPARCKEVFCKSRLEGKKYAEIAAEMNIAVKTVETQMGKALRMLRELLADLALVWVIYLFF